MKKTIVATLVLASGICGAATAAQVTIPLNDSNAADNFLYNNGPTTNFGPNGIFYYDERGTSKDTGRPLIRFDLASLPPCSKIIKVEYQAWLNTYTFIDTNNGNAVVPWPFTVHPMQVEWAEYESNWNERKTGVPWSAPGMTAGVDYDTTSASTLVVSTPINRYISWDVTGLYMDWLHGSRPNYGFYLRGPTGNPNITTSTGDTTDGVFNLLSSEYADDLRRPHLVITYAAWADLNGDSQVDDSDFVIFAGAYNVLDCTDPAMPEGCPADLNSDGFVDDTDFVQFVGDYDMLICE